MQIADKHALKIARDTMRMHCVGARIMGGPDHADAARTIKQLTGITAPLDEDCTCVARQSRDDNTGAVVMRHVDAIGDALDLEESTPAPRAIRRNTTRYFGGG